MGIDQAYHKVEWSLHVTRNDQHLAVWCASTSQVVPPSYKLVYTPVDYSYLMLKINQQTSIVISIINHS